MRPCASRPRAVLLPARPGAARSPRGRVGGAAWGQFSKEPPEGNSRRSRSRTVLEGAASGQF
eukprot:5598026-Pyramimonas_sp.AAC.1